MAWISSCSHGQQVRCLAGDLYQDKDCLEGNNHSDVYIFILESMILEVDPREFKIPLNVIRIHVQA